MHALVTGATGFLGRHLVDALRPDCDVSVLKGDVREAATYEGLPDVDVVYHLAAQVSVPASIEDPASTWRVNVDGTLRLLEWARRQTQRRPRVVLVSSAHVYGRALRSPIDEAHPLRPVTPYGASKLAAEALGMSYHATYGVETVIIRPFNIYGPGQSRGYLIPDILHQIHEGKALILGDTRPVRDFTFITDAVDMLRRAGTAEGVAGEAFNLGSGTGHSVAEVVEMSLRVSGSTLEPVQDPARFRAAEVSELVVDSKKARDRLGWRATVALEDGLRRTWSALGPGKR